VAKTFPRLVRKDGLMDPRELLAIGHEAAYRAARIYDEALNPDFVAFASYYVSGAMLDALDDLLFQERVKRASFKAAGNLCASQTGDGYDVMKHDEHEARRRFRAFMNGVLVASLAAALEEAEQCLDEAEVDVRRDYEHALRILRKGLGQLPKRDRTLLERMFRDGMDLKTAAEAIGMPYGTARARRKRSLEVLHELLVDEGILRAPRPLVVPHTDDVFVARGPPPENDTGRGEKR
jgi:RNA polymerase sigma factor (sigma-70 family)